MQQAEECGRGEGGSVVLGAVEKSERGYGNYRAVVLGLSCVSLELLALVVSAPSEVGTVGTDLTYCSSQFGGEVPVYCS